MIPIGAKITENKGKEGEGTRAREKKTSNSL